MTLFGLFLTPVFYVTLRKFVTRGKKRKGTCCPRRDVADNKNRLHREGGFSHQVKRYDVFDTGQ